MVVTGARRWSIALALLAAGLLLACAAQRPKDDDAAADHPKSKIVVTIVTSEPELQNEGRISGLVVDEQQQPVIGVTVKMLGPGGKLIRYVATDIYGKFITPPLPPGTYSIAIEACGFYTAQAEEFRVVAGSNIELLCRLTGNPAPVDIVADDRFMIDVKSTTTGAIIFEDKNGQMDVHPH
jgi:hypothetical protein